LLLDVHHLRAFPAIKLILLIPFLILDVLL
jgi:hypothetical protein